MPALTRAEGGGREAWGKGRVEHKGPFNTWTLGTSGVLTFMEGTCKGRELQEPLLTVSLNSCHQDVP